MRARVLSGTTLVVAVVALVMAVAGGATATLVVGSGQVKDGSLRGREVAPRTIRGVDVKPDSLSALDFAAPPRGPVGDVGPQGLRGTRGDDGIHIVPHTEGSIPGSGSFTEVVVPCTQPGTLAVHGGMSGGSGGVDLMQAAPEQDGSAWVFQVRNTFFADGHANVHVVCVTIRP